MYHVTITFVGGTYYVDGINRYGEPIIDNTVTAANAYKFNERTANTMVQTLRDAGYAANKVLVN